MILQPQKIALIQSVLVIVWQDGHESYLGLENLRRNCPCAVCQGEADLNRPHHKPQVHYTAASFVLKEFSIVGGYALKLLWADGHATGIYSYQLLRQLGESEQ